jgi:hypothetical protein
MGRGRGFVPRGMGAIVEAVVGVSGEGELDGVFVRSSWWLRGSVRADQTEVGRVRGCGD